MRRNLMRIISLEEQIPEQIQTEVVTDQEDEDLGFPPLISAVEEEQVVVSEEKAKELETEQKAEEQSSQEVPETTDTDVKENTETTEETQQSEAVEPNNGSEENAEDPIESRPVVSMEEEQYMTSEALDLGEEITAYISDAERSIDIAQALEDMATIADSIEAATPAEIALMETAGDIIVAGTDIPAEDAVPSMESLIGGKLAMESGGFRKTADQIWNSIKEFLKKIWEKITGFFYNLFARLPRYIRTAEKILKKAEKNTVRKTSESTFSVNNTYYNAISVDGKAITSEAEFVRKLNELSAFSVNVFDEYSKDCADICSIITKAIDNFKDTESVDDQIIAMATKCFDVFNNSAIVKKLSVKGKTTETAELRTMVWDGFISGGSFVGLTPKLPNKTSLVILNRLQHIHFKFEHSDNIKDVKVTSLPILSSSIIKASTKEILNMLKAIENFERSSTGLKSIVAEAKLMQGACERMSHRAIDNKGNGFETYFKALSGLSVNYARWTNELQSALARFYVPKIGVYLSYIAACLGNYKEK